MKVVIVGAGPIGCFAALEFAKRGAEVTIYEKTIDPRTATAVAGRSFNLTLSYRGLSNLSSELVNALYEKGVPMPQRVIHHVDKTISYQPYGLNESHHILSIPRKIVSNLLLEKAEEAGIEVCFEHESIKVKPEKGVITLLSQGIIKKVKADVIVGCDGSNSSVRVAISKKANVDMSVHKFAATHGYVELNMPMTARKDYALIANNDAHNCKESETHGLHIWPRNNFVLLAQPNRDKTYTTTLFMPMESKSKDIPSFKYLKNNEDVKHLFDTYFPDTLEYIPELYNDFFKNKVSRLKTIRCTPYHCGKTILFGDAAHTMVPFYGQGTNCGFEDVGEFFKLFDASCPKLHDFESNLTEVFEKYSKARLSNCDTISRLSEYNLKELSKHIENKDVLVKRNIERQLHKYHSDKFVPLYYLIAFTNIPYKTAVDQYEKNNQLLEDIYALYDIHSQQKEIVAAYVKKCKLKMEDINLPLEDSRALIQTSIDYLFNHFKKIEEREQAVSYVFDSDNTSKYTEGKNISKYLREYTPPQKATDFRILLDEIFNHVITNGTVHTHPGFMAHVPSGGLFQSSVGEFITRALNRFIGVWIASPGLTQIESNVIHWFCNIIGYSNEAFGYLTTSGSLSNFMGLLCAKNQVDYTQISKYRVYTSSQSHFCIKKASKMIGLNEDQIQLVDVDDNLSIDVVHLITLIEADKKRGLVPLCVVATAGTTNTGSVDDLLRIHEYCSQQDIWLHVDACLGGFFAITKRGKQMLKGIELADSISVDAHKSLFLPHGTAALLVKDKKKLRNTFEISNSSYLPGFSTDDEMVDFCNYGPELSRETRGLSIWLPMKMHGLSGFEKSLNQKLDLAVYLANHLENINQIELIKFDSCIPIVIFKFKQLNTTNEDQLNRDLCKLICEQGNTYITTTALPNIGIVNRVCILHHKTDMTIIEHCIRDIKKSVKILQEKSIQHEAIIS